MRVCLPIAGFLVGLGCAPAGGFLCQTDDQCEAGAMAGQCQADGYCSFPDGECASGQRYGEHAPAGVALQCVPPVEGSGGDAESSSEQPPGSESSSGPPGGDTLALTSGPAGSSSGTSTGEVLDDSGGESTGAPVDPDLVLWLTFDDPVDPFVDLSPYARPTSCELDAGACPQLDSRTPAGTAAAFDGIDDIVEVPHDPTLETDAGLTIALLARNDALSSFPIHTMIARPYGAGAENSWELFFRDQDYDGDNDVVFEIADEAGQIQLIATPPAAKAEWQRIVAVWSVDAVALWIDGLQVASGPAAGMLFDESPVYVGGDLDSGALTNYFEGAIDDVRIWRRVLDDAEIVALP